MNIPAVQKLRPPIILAAVGVFAVAPAQETPVLTFEVATVKHAAPVESGGIVFRRLDPQQVSYRHVNMRYLLMQAWGVRQYQVKGPAWLETEYYNIVGKLPDRFAQEQLPIMLQNLLKERFRLQVHFEDSLTAAYALTNDRGGPRLQPSAAVDPRHNADGTLAEDALRAAVKSGKIIKGLRMSPGRLEAGQITMEAFANALSMVLGRPVIDRTGLQGEFDISLEVSPDDVPGPQRVLFDSQSTADNPPVSIFTSIKRVGLRLDAKALPVRLLIVDHADSDPIEN
ncbi:MAG TPA: TIGR03435 family protein [Bryobacteraceae bacterium]|jgi:uncharacterized protein (TIGR03435 family)|nr:TIGR03435 family protein [Bryobacteraceae bacterium]